MLLTAGGGFIRTNRPQTRRTRKTPALPGFAGSPPPPPPPASDPHLGVAAPAPAPDAMPGLESHDDRRPLRSPAAVFVFQPPHDTAFRGVRLGVCSRRFRGLLAQQDVLLAESSSPEIVSTRRFVLGAGRAGGGGGCRPRVGVRHERPCRGFVPERIGLFGHPSICSLVGSGQRGPDGVGDPLPGGGRDVDVQPAGPLGRFFVQREGRLGACHALTIASHAASDSPRGAVEGRRAGSVPVG